jgi:hypothetical protein
MVEQGYAHEWHWVWSDGWVLLLTMHTLSKHSTSGECCLTSSYIIDIIMIILSVQDACILSKILLQQDSYK